MGRLKDLRIVVAGGAGFVGSPLAGRLFGLRTEVTIIDNFLFGSKIEHLRGYKTLSMIERDVRDDGIVSTALGTEDIIPRFISRSFMGMFLGKGLRETMEDSMQCPG